MDAMELVSVILPTFNRSHLIADAVRSVANQTYSFWELIIVDDGSTDDTKGVVEPSLADSRVRYVHKSNGGAASARNLGLELARGPCVAFIDSDDIWDNKKLEIQMGVLFRHPNVGLVCSDFSGLSQISGNQERSHIRSYFSVFVDYGLTYENVFSEIVELEDPSSGDPYKAYVGNIYETMLFGNVILTSTLLCRRTVFAATGHFDTKYSTLEDYDLFMKMTTKFDVAFVDLPLLTYRYNASQLSGERHFEQLCKNLDEIFEKNIVSRDQRFLAANRLRIKRHRGMIQSQLGYYYANHGQKRKAAQHYWKSVTTGSLNVRNMGYMVACLLPDPAIATLKGLKNLLARREHSRVPNRK